MNLANYKVNIYYPHDLKAIRAIVKKHNGTINMWDRKEKEYSLTFPAVPAMLEAITEIKAYKNK